MAESPPSKTPSIAAHHYGIVPKPPQATAAATRTSNAMRASHPLGRVTRISRSSSSGDSVLSMASWRKQGFLRHGDLDRRALFGADVPTFTLILYDRKDPLQIF